MKKNIIKPLILGSFLVLHSCAAQAQTQQAVKKLKETRVKLVNARENLKAFKTALKTTYEGIDKGMSGAGKYKNDFKGGKEKINDANDKIGMVSSVLPYACTQISTGGIDSSFNFGSLVGTLNDMVNNLYKTYDTALTTFNSANQNIKYPSAPIYAKLDKTIANLDEAIEAIDILLEKAGG